MYQLLIRNQPIAQEGQLQKAKNQKGNSDANQKGDANPIRKLKEKHGKQAEPKRDKSPE